MKDLQKLLLYKNVYIVESEPQIRNLCILNWVEKDNEFIWENSKTLDECQAIYINFGLSDKTRELYKLLNIYTPKPVYISVK